MKKLFLNVFVSLFLLLPALHPSTATAKTVLGVTPDALTSGAILYVKENGSSANCVSWAEACGLQTALSLATAGDEIWVAKGTYHPTANGDRTVSFQLKSGVAIYGGFAGTETSRIERNWETKTTTLSGDLNSDDGADFANNSENSYHVVKGNGVDSTAVLDGFTINGGNANYSSGYAGGVNSYGGGVYNDNANPTLTNLLLTGNSAERGGGGFYAVISSPTLNNVAFYNNKADGGGYGGGGGGMFNTSSSPTLSNVIFNGNLAVGSRSYGGGMHNRDGSSPTLTNVIFSDNSAGGMYGGGGMYNSTFSSATMTNVTFSANSAPIGGGMVNQDSCYPTLTNVTFIGNSASDSGGGIANFDSLFVVPTGSSATLVNAILWGNTPDQILEFVGGGTSTITYSIIQGGWAGTGNIDSDPLLLPLADNGGFTKTHALSAGSLAIDAGDPAHCPATDQRGISRPIDGDGDGAAVCDMGAYEYGVIEQGFSIYMPLIVK